MSEVRLIDANALKEELRQYFTDGVLNGVSAKLAFNQILHDINNAPTVEPKKEIVPVCKVTFDKEQLQEIVDKKVAELVEDLERPQGDLISRSELKKALNEIFETVEVVTFDDIIATIDNAKPVEPEVYMNGKDYNLYLEGYKQGKKDFERPQGEWILVSERLPEEKMFNPSGSDFGFDFEEVLCTTIWGDVRPYKFGKPIGHDKPHFWLGGGIMDEYVIAWQELPEPYKKGGAE